MFWIRGLFHYGLSLENEGVKDYHDGTFEGHGFVYLRLALVLFVLILPSL